MANTTINSTNATVNSVSVSKEENIMATITIKNMAITNKHNENYVSKAMLGEALGYSKTKLLKVKREDLVKEMTDKLTPKMTDEQLSNAVNTVVDGNANGSNVVVELPKLTPEAKALCDNAPSVSMDELENMCNKTVEKEIENMEESIKKASNVSSDDKTKDMLKKISEAKAYNTKNGYGSVISADKLNQIIASEFGIYNLKGAIENDQKVIKAYLNGVKRTGNILITQNLLEKMNAVRNWLIKYNYISEAKYVDKTKKDDKTSDNKETKNLSIKIHEVLDGPTPEFLAQMNSNNNQ